MLDTQLILKLLASFAIGSIPFAVIAMWGSGTSIRNIGSGNPGFNNVLRFDKRRALVALIGDLAKGFVPIWLFYGPEHYINIAWLFGMGAVFGHCYSPWLRFQGGKGVATSAGAMLAMYPGVAALSLAFFVPVRVLGGRFQDQGDRRVGVAADMGVLHRGNPLPVGDAPHQVRRSDDGVPGLAAQVEHRQDA